MLFTVFLKIGLFTIGGGLAMLPLIEREVVERKKWIDKHEFIDLMTIAQSMPGIFAFNFAILIGFRVSKYKGSIVTGLGTVLPSFMIILIVAIAFTGIRDNEYVIRVFKGMRPAVVALILVPVLTSARTIRFNRYTALLALGSAALIAFCTVNPVYIIMAVGLFSLCYAGYRKKRKNR